MSWTLKALSGTSTLLSRVLQRSDLSIAAGMELTLFLSSVLVLCGTAEGQMRQYFYNSKSMNWSDAQSYCRQAYTDLATITSKEENERAFIALGDMWFTWIGLNRTAEDLKSWKWSDGETPQYFVWEYGEPSHDLGNENCVSMSLFGWKAYSCSVEFPVLCQWSINLVTESMTWDVALEFCRTRYTGLAFLTAETEKSLAEVGAAQSKTVSVWFGLRFLDGDWYWTNGMPGTSLVSMSSCPAPRYRCGAYNTGTNVWENRDCDEKLHFLCF